MWFKTFNSLTGMFCSAASQQIGSRSRVFPIVRNSVNSTKLNVILSFYSLETYWATDSLTFSVNIEVLYLSKISGVSFLYLANLHPGN